MIAIFIHVASNLGGQYHRNLNTDKMTNRQLTKSAVFY
jgi:hypothetical protein